MTKATYKSFLSHLKTGLKVSKQPPQGLHFTEKEGFNSQDPELAQDNGKGKGKAEQSGSWHWALAKPRAVSGETEFLREDRGI